MFSRVQLNPAERYSIAAENSYNAMRLNNPTIRRNMMFATGLLAIKLAEAGAALIGKPADMDYEPGDHELYSYYPDFVSCGAEFAFKTLQKIVEPASRQFGQNGFTFSACDETGSKLQSQTSRASESFQRIASPARSLSLGDDREDYWHAGAVTISRIASAAESKPKKIRLAVERLAQSHQELSNYPYMALESVADLSLGAILATKYDQADDRPVDSVYVLVEPTEIEPPQNASTGLSVIKLL